MRTKTQNGPRVMYPEVVDMKVKDHEKPLQTCLTQLETCGQEAFDAARRLQAMVSTPCTTHYILCDFSTRLLNAQADVFSGTPPFEDRFNTCAVVGNSPDMLSHE